MLLVGDIGGTFARLALVTPEHGLAQPVREATLATGRYAGLEALVAEFLPPASERVERIVLAVAGPVNGGRAELSNVGWVLDEQTLSQRLGGAPVHLLNDLVAMASAIPYLDPGALHTLQAGVPLEGGAIAVVAPGTGLGEAYLTWDGARYRAHPSEGGHADFAPTDALQGELLAWLSARFDHVSVERVCSGRGLPGLYDFLAQRGPLRESGRVAERLAAVQDRTPVIVDSAFDEREPSALSLAAVELFAAILAAEAGNAALRVLATGGVYLGGGLPRRVLRVLAGDAFLERFRRKGRLSSMLGRVPVHVITRPGAVLLGAALFARSAEGTPTG